ncbi:SsrA-binding protein [uncultured Winogradskyella sp.]|uniref:SsrA-binding protein n=1 Tax=uncultured Winogradskyella sp. TaxID=395353 RepID=UPI00262803BE|nr:SsrA-binding protein [uncultured Winogradskyella sp.]
MNKTIFKALAKLNKALLPSYTKQRLDLSKASKLQLAIIGWRVYITKNALDEKKTTDW